MATPLKFRYYREDMGKMIMSDDHASLKTFFSFYEMAIKAGHEPSDLMQFTGPTDQEGKEIFAGDIVECEGAILEIKHDEDHACFSIGDGLLTYGHGLYVSVIGNVHANPELLDKL